MDEFVGYCTSAPCSSSYSLLNTISVRLSQNHHELFQQHHLDLRVLFSLLHMSFASPGQPSILRKSWPESPGISTVRQAAAGSLNRTANLAIVDRNCCCFLYGNSYVRAYLRILSFFSLVNNIFKDNTCV